MHQRDYYSLLKIEKEATPSQIKNAYRELAFAFHPDRNKDNPEAVEKMKEINEAYAVLSNPARRKEYDALRSRFGADAHSRFRQSYSDQDLFKGSDINAIIEEMARAFGLRGFDDLFGDVYGNAYRSFDFKRNGLYGKGFFFSFGFPGKKGEKPLISPSSGRSLLSGKWARSLIGKMTGGGVPEKGRDIIDTIHIDSELAGKGGPYAYFLKKRSKKLVVSIPQGIRHGQKIRLAGMGEDGRHQGGAGDLYLKVHIDRPVIKWLKGILSRF